MTDEAAGRWPALAAPGGFPAGPPWPADLTLGGSIYPDSTLAAEAVRQVVQLPEHRLTAGTTGGPWWVSDGGLLVVTGAADTRIGFGIRTSLALSPPLVGAAAQVNQSDPLGHLWLTEDRQGDAWSLIWGATLPHRWTRVLDLQRAVYSCLTEQHGYLRALVGHFAQFGGQAYWSSGWNRRERGASSQSLLEDLV